MAEIKTPIHTSTDKDGDKWYHISPENTISDIARWAVETEIDEELVYLIEQEKNNDSS